MQIHITARRLKLTPAIRSYVEEKIQRAQKYFNHIIWAQVVLSVEKVSHKAEIVIHASRQTFRAEAAGADLYAAVDLATDKIDVQVKKYKDRLRSHHKKGSAEAEPAMMVEPISLPKFSVVKQVSLKPMTRDQAVHEMETLGYNFWVFFEKDTKQVQVIYRRLDDSYGLLQPVKWNGK